MPRVPPVYFTTRRLTFAVAYVVAVVLVVLLLSLAGREAEPVAKWFAAVALIGGFYWWCSSAVQVAAAANLAELEREARAAHKAYLGALDDLKDDPDNPDARQEALRLGREYAALTRELQGLGGHTIFDEVALMNDLNAAGAGAGKDRRQRTAGDT
jgi:hypothetical protein